MIGTVYTHANEKMFPNLNCLFRVLRRLKKYLRATTGEEWLTGLAPPYNGCEPLDYMVRSTSLLFSNFGTHS